MAPSFLARAVPAPKFRFSLRGALEQHTLAPGLREPSSEASNSPARTEGATVCFISRLGADGSTPGSYELEWDCPHCGDNPTNRRVVVPR
jgi:hypothetical protein